MSQSRVGWLSHTFLHLEQVKERRRKTIRKIGPGLDAEIIGETERDKSFLVRQNMETMGSPFEVGRKWHEGSRY
jgi:hypothetical protein